MRIDYYATNKMDEIYTLIDKDLSEPCGKPRRSCFYPFMRENIDDTCKIPKGFDLVQSNPMFGHRTENRNHVVITASSSKSDIAQRKDGKTLDIIDHSDNWPLNKKDTIKFDFVARNNNNVEYTYRLSMHIDELLPYLEPFISDMKVDDLISLKTQKTEDKYLERVKDSMASYYDTD